MTGCVLAIDLGTGGPKVALVDTQGRTLAWRNSPVATTILDGGGAEHRCELAADDVARELSA